MWKRKHGTKKLFELILSAKPNQKILDEIILLRVIGRERLDVGLAMINKHMPTMKWIKENGDRLNNDNPG